MKKIALILIILFIILFLALFFIFQKSLKGSKIQIQTKNNPINVAPIITPENNNSSSEINDENIQQKTDNPEENKPDITTPSKAINEPKIVEKLLSWGYEKSNNRKIDTVIIHTSYNAIGKDPYNLADILSEYKSIDVSPHYIIDRTGVIYSLVSEQNIAYHAGTSKMPDGRTGVNNFSIGVEVMNNKIDKPTDDEYNALKSLISSIKGRYKIKYVLGHSDIAPRRKDDPWNFDWSRLK